MSFSYVGVATNDIDATTESFTTPLGTTDGDIMLLGIICYIAPTGGLSAWTLLDSYSVSGFRAYLYYRIADSEPSSYSVTFTTPRGIATRVVIRSTSSVTVSGVINYAANSTTVACATANASATAAAVCYLGTNDSGNPGIDTPSGYTERSENDDYNSTYWRLNASTKWPCATTETPSDALAFEVNHTAGMLAILTPASNSGMFFGSNF